MKLLVDANLAWGQRCAAPSGGDWLFSVDPTRATYLNADVLSHRFRRLGRAAGIERASLHRLRHTVATVLAGEGKVLNAQARLGHRDPSTTLRHYAHAISLEDLQIADHLDDLLNMKSPSASADGADSGVPVVANGR
jgi:integrase